MSDFDISREEARLRLQAEVQAFIDAPDPRRPHPSLPVVLRQQAMLEERGTIIREQVQAFRTKPNTLTQG